MLLHVESIADTVLRKATEIIAVQYTHGLFGRLWLWWAATMNLFLGSIMLLATRWDEFVQKEICAVVAIAYSIMYLVLLFGGKKPKYGRGVFITHLLWLGQIAWALYVLLA